MRKNTTIYSVLILSLIFLSSGTIESGLINSQTVQTEGIQEAEILTISEQNYRLIPVTKQQKNHFTDVGKSNILALSILPLIATSATFSLKNSLFIRYCSFLI